MNKAPLSFRALLNEALNNPGSISEAYSIFHDYSLGNVMAAWAQCRQRGIKLGPLATYKRWHELGRQVKRGEQGMWLCMPITYKREDPATLEARPVTRFVWRKLWFAWDQTEGSDQSPKLDGIQDWDKNRALATLDIKLIPFDSADALLTLGPNTQGYSQRNEIAIAPWADHPKTTLIHEVAHIVLGHTAGKETHRPTGEVEAECVAYLVAAALGLEPEQQRDARGYIQRWALHGVDMPESRAQRIFKAANAIIRAGYDKNKIAPTQEEVEASNAT